MKLAAILALVLVLLLGGALLYGLVNTQLAVHPVQAKVIPADQQQGEFERLREALESRALIGTAFESVMPGTAADYQFIIYTLDAHNRGLLPAEQLELQVSPAAGDVLCYTDLSAQGLLPEIDLQPGQQGSIRCVLLTRAGARQHAVHGLYLSYYIWGHPFTMKLTYG